MYLNKIIIVGNLTKDPELKAMPSGMKVCSFGMATNRTFKDKNGQKQDSAEYHNIVAFGKQAEVITQYMRKGSQMLVEGRIQTRSWDDKEGKKNYRTEIIIENFQFGNKSTSNTKVEGKIEEEKEEKQDPVSSPGVDGEEINIEDIPF